MNSNNILIITVILAVLLIGSAVTFAVMANRTAPPGGDMAVEALAITPDWRPCTTDRDCMVVETHCGYCGDYESIATIHEGVFNTTFNNQCAAYSGEFCTGVEFNAYPACRERQCVLMNMIGGM